MTASSDVHRSMCDPHAQCDMPHRTYDVIGACTRLHSVPPRFRHAACILLRTCLYPTPSFARRCRPGAFVAEPAHAFLGHSRAHSSEARCVCTPPLPAHQRGSRKAAKAAHRRWVACAIQGASKRPAHGSRMVSLRPCHLTSFRVSLACRRLHAAFCSSFANVGRDTSIDPQGRVTDTDTVVVSHMLCFVRMTRKHMTRVGLSSPVRRARPPIYDWRAAAQACSRACLGAGAGFPCATTAILLLLDLQRVSCDCLCPCG